MIELLDSLFRHPVVIAVLSFLLGTGATLWLNQQARERAEISEAVAVIEEGFEELVSLRLSADRLSEELLADVNSPKPGLLDRIAPLERAQMDQRLAAEAALAAKTYRLAAHLDLEFTDPSAARLLAYALWPITSAMDSCAHDMVDETRRGLGDPGFAENRSAACFSGAFRQPETEDAVGMSELRARAARCETHLLGTLVKAVRSRDQSADLYHDGLRICGIDWQSGAARLAPIEGIYP